MMADASGYRTRRRERLCSLCILVVISLIAELITPTDRLSSYGDYNAVSGLMIAKGGWGPEMLGLQVGLATSKSSYLTGEPVVVSICISNVSTKTFILATDSQWFSDYDYIIVNSLGQRAAHTKEAVKFINDWKYFRTSGGSSYQLRPGEAMHEDDCISMHYDLSAPGEYDITAVQQILNEKKGKVVTTPSHSGTVHIQIIAQ